MVKRLLVRGILLIALLTGLVMGYQTIEPGFLSGDFKEEAKTLETASAEPDLNLLISHVKAMASQVHSVDSPGLQITQDYLKAQLSQMGYSYAEESYALSLDEVIAIRKEGAAYRHREFKDTEQGIRDYAGIGDKPTLNLNNIIVKVDAPDTEDTMIFMAHTDSVKMGPGAFDDTVSVAALLEGLRQIQGKTPARDLIFLFTDGEEQWLLGAAKFVKDHPELKEKTKLVLNFEARGNRGALLMFETTQNNLAMVKEYVKAVPRPATLSIATTVYRMMKNDTDLTRFMMEGYPGMNFAVIEGAEVYHTAQDNVENFDRASANHYAQTVPALVKHFALTPKIELQSDAEGVFFPYWPGKIAVMSGETAQLLGYLAFGGYIALFVLLLFKRKMKWGGFLKALGLQLGMMAGLGLVSFAVVKVTLNSAGLNDYYAVLSFKPAVPLFYGLLALGCLVSLGVYYKAFKKDSQGVALPMGTLFIPALLALFTALALPQAAYYFFIPVFLGIAYVALGRFCRLGLFNSAFVLGTLLLFSPLVYLVFTALSFTTAYVATALAMLPFTMLIGAGARLMGRESKES